MESDKTHECRLRVGSVNVTSMWKREGEVVEMVLGGGWIFVVFRSQDGRVRVPRFWGASL